MIDTKSSESIAKLNYRFLVLVREAVLLADDDPEIAYGISPALCEVLKTANHDALQKIAEKTAERGYFLFGLRDISPRQGDQWWIDLLDAAIENNDDAVEMMSIHGSVLNIVPKEQTTPQSTAKSSDQKKNTPKK